PPEPEPPQGQTLTCQPRRCHPPVPLRPGLMTSSTVTRWNGSYPVRQAPRSRPTPFEPPQATVGDLDRARVPSRAPSAVAPVLAEQAGSARRGGVCHVKFSFTWFAGGTAASRLLRTIMNC